MEADSVEGRRRLLAATLQQLKGPHGQHRLHRDVIGESFPRYREVVDRACMLGASSSITALDYDIIKLTVG